VVGAGFCRFDLPPTSLKAFDALTLGIRPEHLARSADGPFAVEGVVELVERFGESSFAYVRRADDRLLVAEVRGRQTPTPGERATLGAAAPDVHVFDAVGMRMSMQNNL
jgi:ABC-type sugar transport system ATPase subunit